MNSANPKPFSETSLDTVAAIEHAAFDAWPGLDVVQVDGWRLRAAGGITGRANSVWSLEDEGTLRLDAKLAAAEAFYAERGLPARFQMTPAARPAGLDAALEARGYRAFSPTAVQVADLTAILLRTTPLRALPFVVEVSEEFDLEWFSFYATAEAYDPRTAALRAAILERIEGPRAFVNLSAEGQPAAVGLGVAAGEWLGIFCMTTLPAFRRRGAASAILRTLAIWGSLYEARRAYLQVPVSNAAAHALYAGVGFETAYTYHYRIRE